MTYLSWVMQQVLQVGVGVAGHSGVINCLDVSPDGSFLVAVGLNNHSKQLVILWSIAGLVDGHKVTMPECPTTAAACDVPLMSICPTTLA